MRNWLSFGLMVALVLVVQVVSPLWWLFVLVPFGVALAVGVSAGRGFLHGFLACLFVWGGLALAADLGNDGILSYRVAGIFGLPSGWLLVLITSIVGGLLGGLAGWAGGALRLAVAR